MTWRKKIYILCALASCTGILMAAANPAPVTQARKPAAMRDLSGVPASAMVFARRSEAVQEPAQPKPDEKELGGGKVFDAVDVVTVMGRVKEAAVLEDGHAVDDGVERDLRACADCLTPNTDLGDIGTTVWGYSVSGNCGTEGKWYASFNGYADTIYYFDLCDQGTGNFDADIKITNSSCTILAGVDGNSACGWRPDDFTWTCTADGTYYVIIAPYSSYSSHNCTGTASNTFTMYYYSEISPCAGVTPTNDDCSEATPVVLADGVPFTTNGNNCNSTQDAGCFTSAGEGETWIAITLPATYAYWNVSMDMCGTAAGWGNAWLNFALDCPCTGVTPAAEYGWTCANGNLEMTWTKLAAGTYWYPVMLDSGNGAEGDYTITFVATEWQCCPTTVTSFPYCEDFEAGFGDWTQSSQDDLDWTRDNGGTTSSGTGPSVDHTTGTASGYYLYTEATGPSAGDTAILDGPCFDISALTSPQLNFWYHMYGAAMGTLSVEVSEDCDTWNTEWTLSGDQGDQWFNAVVDLSAYTGPVKIRFVGVIGTSYTSDMAIDDVCVLDAAAITGACCDGAVCTPNMSEDACTSGGGTYVGDLTDCDPNPCEGACCSPDGSCVVMDEDACNAASGSYQGGATTCDPNPCPQPGDTCGNPYPITLGAGDLPYVNTNSNCGAGDDYDDPSTTHCLYYYDSGEDIIYELTVTDPICVDIGLDPHGTTYPGIAIGDACPPTLSCIASDYHSSSAPLLMSSVVLSPGTYYIQVDTWSSPDCIPDFTLTITASATGACCNEGSCSEVCENACVDAGGTYLGDGTDCSGDPCAVGACCDDAGSCGLLTEEDCALAGGYYQGDGSNCAPNPCPQPCTCDVTVNTYPYCEDFEAGLGDWTQSADDDFDWTRQTGPTSSSDTGPPGDHTTGSGYYMYTESSSPNSPSKVAILDGPCFDLSGLADPEMNFWYHMYGATMGTLSVQVSDNYCITWDTVWTLSGNQGNEWFYAAIDLNAYAGQTINVRFVGVTGSSYTSDMAIDDVCVGEHVIVTGACCFDDVCTTGVTEDDCTNAGGAFQGGFSDCDPNPCVGACCFPDGSCQVALEDVCSSGLGGDFQGNGTVCDPNPCPQPPPENDLCSNGTVITAVPFEDLDVNMPEATDDPNVNPSCDSSSNVAANNGVWYTYTPSQTCEATLDQTGIDAATSIWTGPDCDNLTQVICSDPDPFSIDLTGGTQYWILVSNWSSSEPTAQMDFFFDCASGACCTNGVCTIETPSSCAAIGGTYVGDGTTCTPDPCSVGACCFGDGSCEVMDETDCINSSGIYQGDGTTCETAVCNDDCGDAIAITDGTPAAQGDNCAAGADLVEVSCQSNSNKDVWYEYVATCTGTVTMDTEGSGQSDTVLTVFDACGGNEVACDDDSGTSTLSLLSFDAIAGQSYLVRVASYSTGCGDFDLNISCAEAPQGACCTNGVCTVDYQLTCELGGGTYGGDGTICAGADCNANGTDDFCEVLEGLSPDCNDNAVPDDCDIAGATSQDCDGNGVPDECDLDCNTNGIPDGCDVTCGADCNTPECYQGLCGTSDDCQPDGVPDECQLGRGGGVRLIYQYDDGTSEAEIGVAAGARLAALNHFTVTGGEGKITAVLVAWGDVTNGTPATIYLWEDPNGDGDPHDAQVLTSAPTVVASANSNTFIQVDIPPTSVGPNGTSFFVGYLLDSSEYPLAIDQASSAGESWAVADIGYAVDPNDLGNPAYNNPLALVDDFGYPGNLLIRAVGEPGGGGGADCNTNGIPDDCDVPPICDLGPPDCSLDCNGDLVPDECQLADNDCDENGIPDDCDIANCSPGDPSCDDCNSNGKPDKCDLPDNDCNGNEIPDECDIASCPPGDPACADCNGNDIPDGCDIADCTPGDLSCGDCNTNGRPDECDLAGLPGGRVNLVLDPSFEAGTPNPFWAEESTNFGTPLCDDNTCNPNVGSGPHTGSWWVWYGGIAAFEVGAVEQDIVLPAAASTTLEFYVEIPTPSGNGTDYLQAMIDGDILITILENDPGYATYALVSLDISSYADGGLHTVRFEGEQSGVPALSNIFLDDVSIEQTGPPGNDCNQNGVPDDCDILPDDPDGNGEVSRDCDENGVPDECQLCGDLDGDEDVDADDYNEFLYAFGSVDGGARYNPCADYDDSGAVGMTDYQTWLLCYRDFRGDPQAAPPGPPPRPIIRPAPPRPRLSQPAQPLEPQQLRGGA